MYGNNNNNGDYLIKEKRNLENGFKKLLKIKEEIEREQKNNLGLQYAYDNENPTELSISNLDRRIKNKELDNYFKKIDCGLVLYISVSTNIQGTAVIGYGTLLEATKAFTEYNGTFLNNRKINISISNFKLDKNDYSYVLNTKRSDLHNIEIKLAKEIKEIENEISNKFQDIQYIDEEIFKFKREEELNQELFLELSYGLFNKRKLTLKEMPNNVVEKDNIDYVKSEPVPLINEKSLFTIDQWLDESPMDYTQSLYFLDETTVFSIEDWLFDGEMDYSQPLIFVDEIGKPSNIVPIIGKEYREVNVKETGKYNPTFTIDQWLDESPMDYSQNLYFLDESPVFPIEDWLYDGEMDYSLPLVFIDEIGKKINTALIIGTENIEGNVRQTSGEYKPTEDQCLDETSLESSKHLFFLSEATVFTIDDWLYDGEMDYCQPLVFIDEIGKQIITGPIDIKENLEASFEQQSSNYKPIFTVDQWLEDGSMDYSQPLLFIDDLKNQSCGSNIMETINSLQEEIEKEIIVETKCNENEPSEIQIPLNRLGSSLNDFTKDIKEREGKLFDDSINDGFEYCDSFTWLYSGDFLLPQVKENGTIEINIEIEDILSEVTPIISLDSGLDEYEFYDSIQVLFDCENEAEPKRVHNQSFIYKITCAICEGLKKFKQYLISPIVTVVNNIIDGIM